MNIESDFEEFFTKRHGELPVDTTSKEYADKSYLKHEMKKAWEVATKKLEGCVVVPHMQPIAVVHNSGLGLFRECMVIYGWNGKSKQYQEALNKGFYFGLEKGIQHVMEAARGGK